MQRIDRFEIDGIPSASHIGLYTGDRWESKLGPHVDVRAYQDAVVEDVTGSDGLPHDDWGPAIQAAIDDNEGAEYCTYIGGRQQTLDVVTPITIPSGAWVRGSGFQGSGITLNFYGTDKTAHCISTEANLQSRFRIERLRLVDKRTASDRTGAGIHINQCANGDYIFDCLVAGFYDNIFVGGESGGQVSDCVQIGRVWVPNALRYGINLKRVQNNVDVFHVMCDTSTPSYDTMQAAIAVTGSQNSESVTIRSVKHECAVSTCDTIYLEAAGMVLVMGVTMRGTSGRDVVRIANTVRGNYAVLMGITSSNTSHGDAATAPVNLLNVVDESFTITPSAQRRIIFWTGIAPSGSGLGGEVWTGRTKLLNVPATPESLVSANPGSIATRDNGSVYVKRSGTGSTGWQRLTSVITGSKTFDWADLASGAEQSTTVTVTGAALGDPARASMSVDLAGTKLFAYVSAANTVTVIQRNDTGGNVNLASGTLTAFVDKV